jgi:hypothetical protein
MTDCGWAFGVENHPSRPSHLSLCLADDEVIDRIRLGGDTKYGGRVMGPRFVFAVLIITLLRSHLPQSRRSGM